MTVYAAEFVPQTTTVTTTTTTTTTTTAGVAATPLERHSPTQAAPAATTDNKGVTKLKEHGLPKGGKDLAGSMWVDKDGCISCVGGGKRKKWVGAKVEDYCPSAIHIFDPACPKDKRLFICQC